MSNIIKLLGELGSDSSLQKEYKDEPQEVMKRYNLNDDEVTALMTGDVEKLKDITQQDDIKMIDHFITDYK